MPDLGPDSKPVYAGGASGHAYHALFVNGHLAVNLGGVHPAQMGSLDMDAQAAELGIAPGNTDRIDIFQAERHIPGSTFHVETTLQCIDNIVP
jgi:fibro-slime domain-containing protein